jgi:adenine-specific DNA-methyltransferase
MQLFATDLEKLAFLLEAEAELALDCGDLEALGAELVTEEVPEGERPKYITNYIGSKQKLVDWIWKHTPEDTESVADAFCGSSVVGYMYKSKGLSVASNDRLRYSFHGARAIVENQNTRIAQEDLDALLAENPKAGTFVRDHFKGIFFAQGVHELIDQIRANIDKLEGYKKDIALFALGKTCLSAKGGFGHFTSVIDGGKHLDTPDEFKERFSSNVSRINALVFDSGKQCSASNQDVNEFLAGVKADLAYFDPPYATEFSTTNYEKAYHFIEGLMSYWDGLKINEASKVKFYETDHQTVTKANAKGFFETFLGSAKHIPNWLISYRDHAYPNEDEMKGIITAHGRNSSMESKDHHYSISAKNGDASNAQERLFICKAGKAATKTQAAISPSCHTAIPVEVRLAEPAAGLSAEAMDQSPAGDPQFTFILCRAGTNKNGDHFTPEELSSRYMTAINKKVDLKHSQDFTDIVGGIIASDFLTDETGGRVECVGELYVGDSPHAQLAYKLMKRGIITQVSMECDYEEGECSICGKRVKNKNEYCPHLAKFKGGVLDGKPVFEILHGVTFTGLGLLDRKGADENARITQVATLMDSNHINHSEGGSAMDDKTKDNGAGEAAKKKPEGGGFPPADAPGGGDKPNQQELEKENKALKQKVLELQKRIDELEAEQKAAANKARAHKLVSRLEKQGIAFGDEDERESEMKRLAGLSDDAFAATEAAYERMVKSRKAEGEKTETPQTEQPEKKEVKASAETPLRSDAGVRPREVDDRKSSLEDQLREGFMAAYKTRVAQNKGDLSPVG